MHFLKIFKTKTFWIAIVSGAGIIANEIHPIISTQAAVIIETILIIGNRFLTWQAVKNK